MKYDICELIFRSFIFTSYINKLVVLTMLYTGDLLKTCVQFSTSITNQMQTDMKNVKEMRRESTT